MSSLNRTPSATPRAHVSPDACPVCHGAGVLPSMTVAGLSNPCPRCTHALRTPSRGQALAHEREWASTPHPPAPPRRRATDRTAADVLAAALLGIAFGIALCLLAEGLFAVFGGWK